MSTLFVIHKLAVEHTKKKIFEDIDAFLEDKTIQPSIEEYQEQRRHYFEQLWLNVWLNKATNNLPRKEKKNFLKSKGYVVEGVDKKVINKLVRNELRSYKPFPVNQWLTQVLNVDSWSKRYEQAQLAFQKRQEEEKKAELRRLIISEILSEYRATAEKDITLFLFIRNEVSKKVVNDYENIQEQERTSYNVNPQETLAHFLQYLSKVNKQTAYGEYEYFDEYNRYIEDVLEHKLILVIETNLSTQVFSLYKQLYEKDLTKERLKDILQEMIVQLRKEYMDRLLEEYMYHLIEVAAQPFSITSHEQLYSDHQRARVQLKAIEREEQQRQKELDARMIDDIFGREYRVSTGRNIRYILHIGETNTGKTYHALERMKQATSGLYLAPLRLLALEVYEKLNKEGIACTLKTGEEEKIVAGAKHMASTVEMFYEKDNYDVVIIDESQMISDKDRGFSWFKAITKANAKEVHIIGSWNAQTMIVQLLGDSEIEIHQYNRDIPLQVESKAFSIDETKKGDALVCFSRKRVLETASLLQKNGFQVSMIYGSMPPETRQKQIQRFIRGESSIVVATDAIGMGLNLPIRRIVFLENEKFDGTRRRKLTSQEVKQIAGRAGRKGIYNVGKVAFSNDIHLMRRLLEQEDEPIQMFAIAPTNSVFERFQKYNRDLSTFFELWDRFESPVGTKKASLSEERLLFETIKGSEIEARLPLIELYGFLHLPFSTKEPELIKQWHDNMVAIVNGKQLPEPVLKQGNLENLELAYKAIGLHLLFLYRLGRKTEAIYWERLREEISNDVHDHLRSEQRISMKSCKQCGKSLEQTFTYRICDSCHRNKQKRKYKNTTLRNNRR